jgi:hypothetical protein
LKLDWIASPPLPSEESRPTQSKAMLLYPSQEKLQMLLELGEIGYVKGILQRLDEIEQQDQVYQPFAGEMRRLVKRFRLNDYSKRIKEMMHHDVDKL